MKLYFFQKNENILNAFKSSWKERDNHDFSQKQRVPVGLNTVFSKTWFSLLPLKSSRKEHFFLKKTKFYFFVKKDVLPIESVEKVVFSRLKLIIELK